MHKSTEVEIHTPLPPISWFSEYRGVEMHQAPYLGHGHPKIGSNSICQSCTTSSYYKKHSDTALDAKAVL